MLTSSARVTLAVVVGLLALLGLSVLASRRRGRDLTQLAKESGWVPWVCVRRVKVAGQLPNCVVTATGLGGSIRPEFAEWFRQNASRCAEFEAADGWLTIRLRGAMDRRVLLGTLDFLVDAAARPPIHES